MAPTKLIVVVGATGNQGGSVAQTFLSLPTWKVRALTRKPSSEAAKALAAQGAEVVEGNLEDPASLDKAFAGANAIFLNTDFWETYMPAKAALEAEKKDPEPASQVGFDRETTNGKNAVDAAAKVPTLERFVYSALHPIKKATGGKYTHSCHSEGKAFIVDYIKASPIASKASFMYPGAYNVNPMLTPRLDPGSGTYMVAVPLKKETMVPILNTREAVGPFVQALIEDEAPGTNLLAHNGWLSVGDFVTKWSEASGKPCIYANVPVETMHNAYAVPWEMLDAASFLDEFGYLAGIPNVIEPSQLKKPVKTRSFEEWLKTRDWEEALKV